MEYLLNIPGRLDNLNDYIKADRTSRYKGAELKADNQRACVMAIRSCLRGVEIHKPVYMEYLWVEKNARRDKDNVSSFGRKVIQDALVDEGVLQNDGWKNIVGFSDKFQVDAENPHIEVKIVEADGG